MENNAFASCTAPTAQDWEDRRSQITQLYQNEDKPLKDVMASVNVRGFKASEKMFKSRITKWGLDKKTKESEARAILKMHAQRNGRPTKTQLRGQSVNIAKIEKYFKRKGISVEDVLSSESPSPSGMDLICRSPSPATVSLTGESIPLRAANTSVDTFATYEHHTAVSRAIPPRIEAPDGLKMVEHLFADVRELMMCVMREAEPRMMLPSTMQQVQKALHDSFTTDWHPNSTIIFSDLASYGPAAFPFFTRRLNDVEWQKKDIQLLMLHAISVFFTSPLSGVATKRLRNQYDKSLAFIVRVMENASGNITCAYMRVISRFRLLLTSDEPLALIFSSLMNVVCDNILLLSGINGLKSLILLRFHPTFSYALKALLIGVTGESP